jgi:acyl-CoA synthetase (AMP-forming)/AMP-acid ligase II
MPNFALHHCARAVRDSEIEGVDLASWKSVVSGGEMVREASLRLFYRRFSPYGLRETALQAGYGMAENVEGITTSTKGTRLRADWIRRGKLQQDGRAMPTDPGAEDAIAIVPCGVPLPGTEVSIVDEEGHPLPDRTVGEIVVRGTYCMSGGYYLDPTATADAHRDGWFLTGDLGYLAGGLLHPCGRKKDVIIVGGHNIQPEDVEDIAAEDPAIAPGRVVAFGVSDDRSGTERIVVVWELRGELDASGRRALEDRFRRRVVGALGVVASEVRFVERGWVVKTSSGKLARRANRAKYLDSAAV